MDWPHARSWQALRERLRRAFKLLGFDGTFPSRTPITAMNDTVIQPRSALHPQAGHRMSGAQMIVQVLADEGVSAIFGYSGGAILPTYDAVFLYNEQRAAAGQKQMPLYVPANEQGAGFMAAGYARASGRVGVCLVPSGPGATHTV